MSKIDSAEVVLLVGHGGVPADAPGDMISELKRLEAGRRARGQAEMDPREAELDGTVRNWPRTPETDPYKWGLEAIAERLRPRLGGRRLETAYNEFCAPSAEDAIDSLAAEGVRSIVLLTTMFTPGGNHSEEEIPELVELAQARHPGVSIRYAWPFDLDSVADLLAAQANRSGD